MEQLFNVLITTPGAIEAVSILIVSVILGLADITLGKSKRTKYQSVLARIIRRMFKKGDKKNENE